MVYGSITMNSRQTYENTARLIDDVITHAFARFARYGYKKTTVDEIAADIRISKRTLYIVFPSKEAILHEGVWRELMAVMDTFKNTLSPDCQSSQLLLELCRYIITDSIDSGKNGLFYGLHADDEYIRVAWYGAMKRIYRDILQDGTRDGVFKPVNCDLAAETMMNIIRAVFNRADKASSPRIITDQTVSIISDSIHIT